MFPSSTLEGRQGVIIEPNRHRLKFRVPEHPILRVPRDEQRMARQGVKHSLRDLRRRNGTVRIAGHERERRAPAWQVLTHELRHHVGTEIDHPRSPYHAAQVARDAALGGAWPTGVRITRFQDASA